MLRVLRRTKRAALHLAAAAAVLGAAAGTIAYGAQPAHAELTPENGLLVSTRSDYRMCVHIGEGVDDPQKARAELTAGLAQVQKHPDWKAAFGSSPAPARLAAAGDCPEVRLPTHLVRGSMVGPGVTGSPSPYRTWVHVLDERTADRVLGEGVPVATATAEAMPAGEHHAAAVSTAVLVRRSHLDDAGFRGGPLTEAVGLQPRTPPVAGPHSVKEDGRH